MRTLVRPLLLILLAPGMAAHAAKSDRSQPMDIEAASATADLSDNGSITLSGRVLITQGSMKVQAPSAVLLRRGGEPYRIVFQEGASISQLLDNGTPVSGSGDIVEYSVSEQVATLQGNAQLRRPQSYLQGDKITYSFSTGSLKASSVPSSAPSRPGQEEKGRVKMRIQPRSHKDPAS